MLFISYFALCSFFGPSKSMWKVKQSILAGGCKQRAALFSRGFLMTNVNMAVAQDSALRVEGK